MIKQSDLNYSRHSNVDPFGRVFFHNGEVYRIVNKSHEEYCRQLLSSQLIADLHRLRYIPATTIDTELNIEGHPLILHHEKCTIIRSYEWSFEMFKAACILMLQLQQLCDKYGYQLKDAHPDNITFHQGRAVFFDLGSIVKKECDCWPAQEEFVQTMVLPLILLKDGDYCLSRLLAEGGSNLHRVHPSQEVTEVDYFKKKLSFLLSYRLRHGSKTISTRSISMVRIAKTVNSILRRLKRKRNYQFFTISSTYNLPDIAELSAWKPKANTTEWGNYQLDIAADAENPRFNKICDIVSCHCGDAQTMLDLAGNGGAFAYLVHTKHLYRQILVGDYDENAINKGFLFFQQHNIPISMIWMNCILPFEIELTTQRLKSDIVFALAITHHLILRQGFHVSTILKRLKQFSEKYVAVEFMPLGLWGGGTSPIPEVPEWYTFDWFKQAFEQEFRILHVEEIAKNRVLFVGQIITD